MQFRKDINGIRAIAVIAVVLFHFMPSGLPGGFAGVDVFFVISGYLMTGIVFSGLEMKEFSLKSFYLARFRRIAPALILPSLVLMFFGWFTLTAIDYVQLSKHVAASLGFFSNFVYLQESGYFAAGSKEKWLLHTWSLSVEWQFYLIYPLVLVVLKKWLSLRYISWFLILSTLLGLAFSILATPRWPESSYFLLPARAWEMMVGGLAYLYPLKASPRARLALDLVASVLLLLSFTLLSEHTPWPGYHAMLPVAGTFLMVQAQRESSLITSSPVFQSIGKASYSIYLWHWPIVVGLFTLGYGSNTWFMSLGITLSFLIGFASERWVEKPFKYSHRLAQVCGLGFAALAMCLVVLFTAGFVSELRPVSVSDRSEYQARYHRDSYKPIVEAGYRLECDYFDGKRYLARRGAVDESCTASTGVGGIFIWGDSHAQALSHGVRFVFEKTVPIYQVATSGCRPFLSGAPYKHPELKKACDDSNRHALKSIKENRPELVVIAQSSDHENTDYSGIAKRLRGYGVSKLIVIGPVPQWHPTLPSAIAKRHWQSAEPSFTDPSFDNSVLVVNDRLQELYPQDTDGNIEFISLTDVLCEGRSCLATVGADRAPLVWDYGHLSLPGSEFVAKNILRSRLEPLLGSSKLGNTIQN